MSSTCNVFAASLKIGFATFRDTVATSTRVRCHSSERHRIFPFIALRVNGCFEKCQSENAKKICTMCTLKQVVV